MSLLVPMPSEVFGAWRYRALVAYAEACECDAKHAGRDEACELRNEAVAARFRALVLKYGEAA